MSANILQTNTTRGCTRYCYQVISDVQRNRKRLPHQRLLAVATDSSLNKQINKYKAGKPDSAIPKIDPNTIKKIGENPVLKQNEEIATFFRSLKTVLALGQLEQQFYDFDLEGKRLFSAQWRRGVNSLDQDLKALRQSQDPVSSQFMVLFDQIAQAKGTTWEAIVGQYNQLSKYHKQLIQEDEETGMDPEALNQKVQQKEQIKQKVEDEALNEIIRKAQSNPKIKAAIMDIMENKGNQAKVVQYLQDPELRPIVQQIILHSS